MLAVTRTTSGFTLIELVLVLAIMAVALATVAPSLSGFAAGRKPEEAAAQFVALTRLARSQAISEGETYQIILDTDAGRWWLVMADGDSVVEPSGPWGKTFTVPDDVRLECDVPVVNGQRVISFDPSGRSDTAVVRFVGRRSAVEVTCDAPIDEFHIVRDQEVRP